MTRARWGLVGLAIAFFVYTVSAIRVGFSPYDDAVFTYGGWALARGHVPYEDFWTLYNPGQFLLIGAFFRFVSESVLAFRVFEAVIVAASGMLVWDICRRLYSTKAAIAAASFFVLWLGAGSTLYPFHENHTLTSLFLLLASVDLFLVAVPGERNGLLALSGLCAGVCFVIRQDAVIYVVLPELVALVVWRALRHTSWKRIVQRTAVYVAGAAAPVVLVIGWIVAVAPEAWWEQAVVFPLAGNPGLRGLPYSFTPLDFSGAGGVVEFLDVLATSARSGFFYYLPFLIALFACAVTIVYLRRRSEAPLKNLWGFGLVTLVLAASLDYSRVRSDFEHIFPSILLSFLVIPGMAAIVAQGVQAKLPRRAIAGVAAVVLVFALMIPTVARVRVTQALAKGVELTSGPLAGIVMDNRTSGGSTNWAQVQAAADYVIARTDEDERLFVSSTRNDRFFTNYPVFYVLAERAAGTVHAELYPGLTTTERTQQSIISELEEADVRYVIRWPAERQPCVEPNLACHPTEPGSTVLDEYLRDRYYEAAEFDTVQILRRTV